VAVEINIIHYILLLLLSVFVQPTFPESLNDGDSWHIKTGLQRFDIHWFQNQNQWNTLLQHASKFHMLKVLTLRKFNMHPVSYVQSLASSSYVQDALFV